MLLIIGGKASGKLDYARSLGYVDAQISDAGIDERPVVNHLESIVSEDPENAKNLLPRLLEKDIVICDEMGSGIVPMDRTQRVIREETGRLCIELAKEAKTVVRMFCGIPTVIKGE